MFFDTISPRQAVAFVCTNLGTGLEDIALSYGSRLIPMIDQSASRRLPTGFI